MGSMENEHRPVSKRWEIAPLIPGNINQELRGFSPLLRQLMYNRGISDARTAEAYVTYQPGAPTGPFLMNGMAEAVALLHEAIEGNWEIAVYGDYDADGVTSSALLYEFIGALGKSPRVYIPNRYEEGYGLNSEAIETLADEGVQLMITVDCGIRSLREVARARELGMKVIVTDHHTPDDILPDANAVINPQQTGDLYPYKHLAGVGLAYKLAAGYLAKYPHPDVDAEDWLDLVALGTVADIAPLTGENRSLVQRGLLQMRGLRRQGLFSLAQVSGIKLETINAGQIGFGVGPRLNAAGRLDSAMAAFELLTAKDLFTAGRLALQLDEQNSQRKDMTHQIQTAAVAQAMLTPDAPVAFAISPEYSEGIVGLAASKVAEALYRPAIIGRFMDGSVKASSRSIPEFNLIQALDACEDLLERHGGHAMAAGLTFQLDKLEALRERLSAIAEQAFEGVDLKPKVYIDYEIQLEKVRPEHVPGIFQDMAALEPTGEKNPETLFCSRGLEVRSATTVGKERQHLKMTLRAGNNNWEAIAFGQGYWLAEMPKRVDIAYVFDINDYQGRQSVQLQVRDLRAAEDQG